MPSSIKYRNGDTPRKEKEKRETSNGDMISDKQGERRSQERGQTKRERGKGERKSINLR